MDPMNDLDRELTAALGVQPSREFAARVRARIATEPAPARWTMPRLALVTGTLALAALAANLMLVQPASITSAATRLPHVNLVMIEPLRVAPISIAPRLVSATAPRMEPEVVVSRSEMLALQRLFAGLAVAAPALAAPPDELSIPEIVIEPIAPLVTGPEGERQ